MQTIKAASAISMMRSRLYGKGRARTPLFKAITGVLAAEMTLMGLTPAVMAANLPQSSAGYGAGMNVSGQKLTIDGAQGAGSSFTWDQGFNIGQGYTVQFQNITAAVNKDTSGQLSSILGNLFSDGAVYILNPNGILFGPSAVVDVHGLIAAAVGSVGKGPDGEFVFSKLGSGNVVNQGSISAGDFAYLVGRSVENSGSISAANVALAAFGGTGADSITIASTESGAKITFQIPEGAIAEAGEDDGGEVAVSGTITGIQNEQAQNEGGARRAAATPIPDPVGGTISIAAANVSVEQDVSADNVNITGSSSVKIGTLKKSVTITAAENIDATAQNGNLNVYGNLDAGGDITLEASQGISLSAGRPKGVSDPPPGHVVAGGNVDMTAGGNISVNNNSVTSTGTDKNVTMTAAGDISVSGDVEAGGTITMDSIGGYVSINSDVAGGSVNLTANEQIQLSNGKSITANNGGIEAQAGKNIAVGGSITASGDVDMKAGTTFRLSGTTTEGASVEGDSVTLDANDYAGALIVTDPPIASSKIKSNDGDVIITGKASSAFDAAIESVGGDIAITIDNGDIDLKGSVDGGQNDVSITAGGDTGTINNDAAISGGNISLDAKNVTAGDNGSISGDKLGISVESFDQQTSVSTIAIEATGTGGSIKIDNDKALTIGTVGEGTDAISGLKTADGDISVKAAGAITVEKDVNAANGAGTVTLDAGTAKIIQSDGTISGGTVTLKSNAELNGNVTAEEIDAAGKTLTQDGGTISANVVEALKFVQKNNGTLKSNEIKAAVEQQGCTIVDNGDGTITITGNVTQNAGTIGGDAVNSITVNGKLTQADDANTGETALVKAGTLVLNEAAVQEGNLAGDKIVASKLTLGDSTKDISLTAANEIQEVGGTAAAVTLKTTTALAANGLSTTGDTTLDAGANKVTFNGANDAANYTLKSNSEIVNGATVTATTQFDAKTADKEIEVKDGGSLIAATVEAAKLTTAGTIKTDTIDAAVTQTAGTINRNGTDTTLVINGKVTQNGEAGSIGGDYDVTIKELDQDAGTITATTLTLQSDSTVGGTVSAAAIAAGANTLTQDWAGTITVTGADGITAGKVVQTAAGTIKTDKISGAVEQTGTGAAALQANGTALVIDGKVTQNAANATIGTSTTATTIKELDQDAGTINATTLTLQSDSTVGGTVSAATLLDASGTTLTTDGTIAAANGEIKAATLDVDGGTVNAKNVTATTKVDQDGGAITVAETITGNVEQKGATEAVTLSAKKIDGTLTQESGNSGIVTVGEVTRATEQNGGKILKHADAETLVFDSTVEQKNGTIATMADDVFIGGKLTQSGGKINASSLTLEPLEQTGGEIEASAIYLDRGATQTASGKIVVQELNLQNSGMDVDLSGNANEIAKVRGTTKNMTLNNAGNGLVIGNASRPDGQKHLKVAENAAITTAGSMTQEGYIDVGGVSTLKATTDITLANAANNFGSLKATAGSTTTPDTPASIFVKDANDLTIIEANAIGTTAGDIRIIAANSLTVNGEVSTAARPSNDTTGNIRLEATGGALAVDGAVSGNNVTLASGTTTDSSSAISAAKDLYVKAGGNIELSDAETASAGAVAALVSDSGTISAKKMDTPYLYTSAAGKVETAGEIGQASVNTDGDVDVNLTGDATVAYNAGGHVEVSATGALTVDVADASGAGITVTEVESNPANGTSEVTIGATSSGNAVEGVTAGDYVSLQGTSVTVNKNVAANSGDVTITATTGDIAVNGSKVEASAGGVKLDAAQAITIQSVTGSGTTTKSQIIATGGVDIDAGGNVILDNSTVKSGAFTWDGTATAPVIADGDNANMTIDAGGDITVRNGAAVGASGTLGLTADGDNGILINGSKVASKGNMTTAATQDAKGSINVVDGYVGTRGKLDINAAKDVTIDPSTVESEDDIDIDATAGNVVIEASKVASSKTIMIGKDANVGGDVTIKADGDTRSLVMAKTGLAANANGNITIDKSTVVAGLVDDGQDNVDQHVSDAAADMAINAGKAVAIRNGARVGAADEFDIDSGAEGVAIDGAGTKAVAKNGDMTIDANNGAVTVSGGAYVGGNGAIDIGKTTGKTTTSLTVKDASQLVAAGNVSAKVSDAIAVQDTAKVGSDAQVALEATDANATITVADSALVIAKDKVELKAANGTVALTDTAKVRVTGGAAAQDPALVLNGGKGVTASASTTIDATGANLDVDAKTGAIALNGKILAKDADFTAKKDGVGQAITANNEQNNFTGTVTADGASVTLKDKNAITLGDITATGAADAGSILVETVDGTITVDNSATVKSDNDNVKLTASTDANATAGDIVVNGTVDAKKTATLTADKGDINVNAEVKAENGTATLDAGRNIRVKGDVTGKVADLDAGNFIQINGGKKVEATAGNLTADAGGSITVLGTAKASDAVKLTAATVNNNQSIKVDGANAVVEGKSVSLDASAGKSVQVLNGASVTATAGDIVATAKEYIALAGTVEATGGDVELTTTDAETLTAAVGGYAAGAPAGILQLAGTVNGENVKLDSKGSISTAAGTTIQATDGNVAMTARGTSTESPAVTQGITLGGTTTAKTDVNLHAQNGSFKNTGTITATEGDVRIQAKDAVDINGAVAANARPVDSENKPIDTAGNVRISSTDGAVATTAMVDGNNITVVAKKSAKLNAKATAARDIYVDSGEKLTVASTGAQAGETMALVSGKDIDAQNLNAATLYTKDETGATLNGLAVKDYKGESKGNVNLTFNGDTADGINVGLKTIGGDIDVTVNSGDATVAMDASGHANATVNGGTLTIDEVSAISGGALKVTEVKAFTAAIDANPGTQEKELIVANAEGGKVTGVTAGTSSTLTGKDVVVNKAVWAKAGNATITATTGDITVNGTTVKAGTFTVDEASGAVPVEKTGNLIMDAKKAVLIQTVEIEGTKYAAQVGASGTAYIDSGVGGVTVTGKAADNTPTRLVANGAMTIDADGGAVTIENNATVASHDAITIGGDTTKDTKNVTVGKAVADGVDKSQLVSGKNLSVTASESILAQNTTKVGSDAMVTLSATGEGATVKVDAGALVIAEEKADVKAEKGSAEISGTVQGKTEAVVTAKTLVDVKESGVVKATADKGIASVSATGGNVEVSGTVEATGKGGEASVTAAQGTATVTKTGSVKADGEKGDGDKVAKATVSGKSVTIAAEGAAKGTVSAAKGEAAVEATAGKADIAGTVMAANKAEVKASGGDEEVNAVVSGTVTATADVGVASVESTDKNATISGTVKAEGERAKAEVAAATSATVTETGKVQADAKGATASVTGASAEVKAGGQVSAKKGEASVTATGEGGKATIAGMVKAEEGTASVKAENGSAEISGTVQGKTEASVTAKTLAEVKEFGVVKATADKGIASVSATGGNAKVSGTVEATGEKAKTGVAAATSVMVTETGKVQANGEGGDVVVDGKTGVTVAGTVKAADNVRVAAESGGVKVDGTVTAGNNATLEADAGDVTISKGKKVTATNGDVLAYAHDGNVIVKGNVSSTKGTTVLKADKADKKDKADKGNVKISSDATVKTKDLGIDASKAITITAPDKNLDVSGNAALKAANDITVKEVAGDISIAAKSTGGNVTIDIPGKVNILGDTTVAAKKVAADGSAKKTVKVNVNGLDAAGKAKIDASGISGASVKSDGDMTLTVKENGDYNVRNTDAKGDLVLTVGGNVGNKATVESITAGGNATMDVGKDIVSAENVTAGGAIDLDVDGNANVGTVGAKGEANLDIGGNLTAGTVSGSPVIAKVGGSTQVNAVNGGGVQVTSGGQAQFGSVTGGKVEIDAGGVKTTGAGIIKSTDLTVKSRGDIDVTLDSQKITLIDGRNVKITEKAANDNVTLGSIKASGDLVLTAKSIGLGNHGATGYLDDNGGAMNLSSGGDMKLNVAGRMGKASDPLEISVGGKLTLDSGDLHGSNEDNPVAPNLSRISFFYLISTGEAPNMNDSWNQYDGAGKIPGIVIYKGQILAASPDLWLKINRALAFTIDTPELKSKQGVFGTPLFVHTDMDVSEAASIGSVDYVSIADTIMDTLADPDVNDRLIDIVEENDDPDLKRRFDIQRKNPLGRDALYSKEFQGKTQAERDAEAKAKAERAAAAAKAKADARAAKEIKARAEAEAKAKAKAEARAKAKAEAEAKAKAAREAEAKAAREAKSKAKVEAKASAKADVAMK